MPPNGRRGSERTKAFTKHDPASSSWRAMRSPRARSAVKTAAPRPKTVKFASRMASFSSVAALRGEGGHAGRPAAEDARRIEGAGSLGHRAAEPRARALREAGADLAVELVAQIASRLRADRRRVVERVAPAPRL